MTPNELAGELGVDPKRLRDWLRETYPRSPAEHGQPWVVDEMMANEARRHFGRRGTTERGGER